jgi:hypothetical protein
LIITIIITFAIALKGDLIIKDKQITIIAIITIIKELLTKLKDYKLIILALLTRYY